MRALLGILIAVIIIGGVWFFLRPAPTAAPTQPSTTVTTPETSPVPPAVTTVTISGKNFAFTEKEIRVKKGSRVLVTFANTEGFHDWVVDEFNARTKKLNTGESDTIEFTADKAGTFEYYCSVGEHRKMGMVGKLIVE